jgi:hypothetical protein
MAKTTHFAQAVGSYEAAAILGIHFTQPRRMVEKGLLTAYQPPKSLYTDDPSRSYAIYDGGECEADYQAYNEAFRAKGGKTDRRPRAWVHLRPDVIQQLKAVKHPIAFSDAIGMAEAAQILSVHQSLIPRMIASGKIAGRRPWNPRTAGARIYIISRASCQQNMRETIAREAAGKKPGVKRRRKVS